MARNRSPVQPAACWVSLSVAHNSRPVNALAFLRGVIVEIGRHAGFCLGKWLSNPACRVNTLTAAPGRKNRNRARRNRLRHAAGFLRGFLRSDFLRTGTALYAAKHF